MGYFPNGTSGERYQAKFCFNCVHWLDDYGCPCWTVHNDFNYAECNRDDSILHKMIPRGDTYNEACSYFYQKPKTRKSRSR